tara:strand:+ start:292 stop:585 length:294 start_codon:yes stop_codon:yes gene_type:complete
MNPLNIFRSIIVIALLLSSNALAQPNKASAEDIKQQIIQESIINYNGNCPCPYNRASNGSRCGKRSAYSKPGGAEPICYKSDIDENMIKRYRKRKGL